MRLLYRFLVAAVLLFEGGLVLLAQDKSGTPNEDGSPQASSAEVDLGPANDKFNKMFADLKVITARLVTLQERYRVDSSADKAALKTEFEEQRGKANALLPDLTDAAEKAFVEAPNKNQNVNAFLRDRLLDYVRKDDFTPANKMVNMMVEHNFQGKLFDYLAGLTRYANQDFEAAERYLTKAKDSGEIDADGARYLAASGNYKQTWKQEQEIRAAEDAADDLPKVKLSTTKGDIVILLYENEAPNTVANFINLIEKKYYDGLKFHRVLPGFMAQGGDPKGDGSGGPGYTIPDEYESPKHRLHYRGTLSMARSSAKNSGGSQFFLTFLPVPHLDGQYTAFGRVIEGEDVLAKLERINPEDPSSTATPDKIVKATVLRKRNHPYEPLTTKEKR